jgi:hypothetical protein
MKSHLTLLFFVLLIQGCTTPAIVMQADSQTVNRAMSFDVAPDRSRVYFISGRVVENMFNMSHRYPSDFILNGKVIGSKNKDDVMVFEVKPGPYDFSWNVRSTDLIDKNASPQIMSLILSPGEIIVLQGDYSMGGGAMFGLIGSMVSPPKTWLIRTDRSKALGRNVVLPQECQVNVCLN